MSAWQSLCVLTFLLSPTSAIVRAVNSVNHTASPSFIKRPEMIIKKPVGGTAVISCRVFGAPKPSITWFFQDMEIDDPRLTITSNGDLVIHDITERDRGEYKCLAENDFGKITAQANLVVRQRTMITYAPADKSVNASTDVVFRCYAVTDPMEEYHLRIMWKKNGKEINFAREPRMRLNLRDQSLTILAVTVEDSADYTCVADNGLDQDHITANLQVKDRPSPPIYVRLALCSSSAAVVTWIPGNENNEPLIETIVYQNTSFDRPGEFTEVKRIGSETISATVGLSPWANYTFHVRARNSLGISDPSEFTFTCPTPSDSPYENPANVSIKSMGSDKLVINWEPMKLIDHNGRGFLYIIRYRLHQQGAEWNIQRVYDWQQRQLVIANQDTSQKYEISVEAANEYGKSYSTPEVLFYIPACVQQGNP